MERYRKKPVVIEAIQYTRKKGGNLTDILVFSGVDQVTEGFADDTLEIPTLEGTMTAQVGDWIIRGVKGELYPCKPDIFAATYEAVE